MEVYVTLDGIEQLHRLYATNLVETITVRKKITTDIV